MTTTPTPSSTTPTLPSKSPSKPPPKQPIVFPDAVWAAIQTYAQPIQVWVRDGSPAYRAAWMGLPDTAAADVLSLRYRSPREVEWLKAWAAAHTAGLPVDGRVVLFRDEYSAHAVANWWEHLVVDRGVAGRPTGLQLLEEAITSTEAKAWAWAKLEVAQRGPLMGREDWSALELAIHEWVLQCCRPWELSVVEYVLGGGGHRKGFQLMLHTVFTNYFIGFLNEGTQRVEQVRCLLDSGVIPPQAIRSMHRRAAELDDPPFWRAELEVHRPTWEAHVVWGSECGEVEEEEDPLDDHDMV